MLMKFSWYSILTFINFTGEGKVGTDESEFNRILTGYSFPVLRATLDEYQKIEVSLAIMNSFARNINKRFS